MRYKYKPKGVCASSIEFDINNGIISNVVFDGGCDGNSKGISKFVDGMSVLEIEKKCGGIRCESKITSCPDQLAKAVREAYNQK